MGIRRKSRMPSSFPALWHNILRSENGEYIIGNFIYSKNESEIRKLRNLWGYFLFSLRNHQYFDTYKHLEDRKVRLKTHRLFRNGNFWLEVVVVVERRDELMLALKRALAE